MGIFGRKSCKEGHLMDSSWKHCPVCLAPVIGWLVELKNSRASKIYTIHEGKNKVGQGADCEVRILLEGISRNHALLRCIDGVYSIIDVGSEKGIRVNYKSVTNTRLIDGDIITLGDRDFKFKCL